MNKIISKLITRFAGQDKKSLNKEQINYENDILDFSNITAEDLKLMLKFGKASDSIGKYQSKRFIELPYGLVRKDIPNLIKEDKIADAVLEVLKIQHDDFNFNNVTGNQIISFVLWILKELEFLGTIEKNNLSTDPEMEMRAAGIDRMNEFGVLPTIHALSGKDLLKHKEIEALPYFEIYQILKMEKVESEVMKNYNEIKSKK